MLTISVRLKRLRFILLIVLLIAGIPALAAILLNLQYGKQAIKHKSPNIQQMSYAKSNEQRINFLSQYGWEVEDEPIEVVDVAIPTQFSDVYTNYNTIQKKQNYNLEKFKGKTVKRYTYKIKNYPQAGNDEIRANILVYDERVIGGDVSSVKLDGFMHGFKLE